MLPAALGTLGTLWTLGTLRRALVAGAVSWAASIVAAAFVVSRPAGPAAYAFALAVYSMGSVLCHQRPERSFHLWMVQLPVCARCTGIYAGAALGALAAAPFLPTSIAGALLRERPGSIVVLLVAASPTALTLGYEWVTGSMTPNMVRAAAGALVGAAVAPVLLAAAGTKRPEVN